MMTIPEFIAKWRKVELKERSAAQEHFLDLCHVFEHPTPAAADPTEWTGRIRGGSRRLGRRPFLLYFPSNSKQFHFFGGWHPGSRGRIGWRGCNRLVCFHGISAF